MLHNNTGTIGILSVLCIILLFLLNYSLSRKKVKQLEKAFASIFILLIFWMVGLILQIICSSSFNINPIYFDYFVGISGCFLSVAFFFLALIFARTKIKFEKKYLLLFIVPTLSLILLWTNDLHHLFYIDYSTNTASTVFGKYFYFHTLYNYVLYGVSLFILLKYSIKNSGFFSKQATLIFIGTLIPLVINFLGASGIISISLYMTPIMFTFTVMFFAFAIFKFSLFKTTPIALQRIVDRISDSYIVINENAEISDFNRTFINTFKFAESSNIRGLPLVSFLDDLNLDVSQFQEYIKNTNSTNITSSFELYIKKIKKYFNIEITSILVNNQFLGTLILFKDITQHMEDMQTIKDSQETLMESERLASLGQLIGGIAHNLKTPIMSISGALEGLSDLIKEYDLSIENPNVNASDHHEIAKDMNTWIIKMKDYTQYMSDIITAVKGQAVNLSETENISFDLEELVKRIDILMKHELKNAIIYLNVHMQTNSNLVINGDINSLIQVINNMISNSIQAYNGKTEESIELSFEKDNNNLIISIEDHASGLPKKVKDKLFKEMITTKGKNGTGLGLYMSYSTIKANFGGNITFESEEGKGTKFNIILPL